jgi:ComF family protein
VNCHARDPDFDVARAVFSYEGPVVPLIKAFKFEGEYFLGPLLLKDAFASGWMPVELKDVDVVAPVPLHPRRERERGYDQAALLAGSLARALGVPARRRALRRVRYTDQQALLPSRARWENVRGAFEPGPHAVEGLKVLLVDDVMTTGATASECARVLKKAGAAGVSVLTLARARP